MSSEISIRMKRNYFRLQKWITKLTFRCATDTKAIQVVIDSVIDVVIQQTMSKVGIQ